MKVLINSIVLLILAYGCGFKIVNQSELIDFYISQIEATGDKKINYNLKNKLIFKASDENNKQINLNIVTDKQKSVKEKNSSNEITKYEIKLNVKITVNHDEKDLGVLNLTDKISYNVNSQYSQTIINENQAIKTLTSGLVDQILKELSLLNLNDL